MRPMRGMGVVHASGGLIGVTRDDVGEASVLPGPGTALCGVVP